MSGPDKPLIPNGYPAVPSAFDRLLERRMVFLRGELSEDRANELVAQLLWLEGEGSDPITMLIDSPGGATHGMLAVHDTMVAMAAPVATHCLGMAASAGAFLLATGTGRRSAGPNARIMLHQPIGGAQGTAADVAILAEEITSLRRRVDRILAEATGQSEERIHADTDRDFWMSAEEARDYGVLDEVAERGARP